MLARAVAGCLLGAACALVLTGCPAQESHTPPAVTDPQPASRTTEEGPAQKTKPADVTAGPRPQKYPRPEDGVTGTSLLEEMTIRVGRTDLKVWIADTPESRELGLMHVKSMPEDRGMLFVYPEAGRRSFWMKNTFIPLSLAYITSGGKIAQILDMEPHVTRGHPSQGAARLVLEVNQGWFQRHKVTEGVTIPGIEDLRGH